MKKRESKKFCLFGGITCGIILITCLVFGLVQGSVAKASCNSHTGYITEELSWKTYRASDKKTDGYYTEYPTSKQGTEWLFAGWYEDSECKTPLRESYTEDKAHAKFVPSHVLGVKAQVSANLLGSEITDTTTGNMRFVTSVDSLNYAKIGMDVLLPTGNTLKSKENINVYKKLYAVGDDSKTLSYKASDVFCEMSKYFNAYTVTDIPSSYFERDFQVTPYWVTQDGTLVKGVTVSKTVTQGIEEAVTVTVKESENGTIVTDMDRYSVGDVVVLTVTPNEGYDCTSVWVNDKEILPKEDGTYSFVATEKEYTVKATFEHKIFADGSGWDTSRQHEGIVTLPEGGHNGNLKFAEQYGDIDLTITARDYLKEDKDNSPRTDVKFAFTNGKYITFSVTKYKGAFYIESVNDKGEDNDPNAIYGWASKKFTGDELTKFQSEEGIQFRIVRTGTKFTMYLNGVQAWERDCTDHDNGKDVTADMKADIYIRHWGDSEVDVEIPFTLKTAIFAEGSGWNTSNQLLGSVTLPKGGDNFNLKFAEQYADIDLTITARDYLKEDKDNSPRTDVKFAFTNGKYITFSVTKYKGAFYIESVNDKGEDYDPNAIYGWTSKKFTGDELTKFQSEEGIQFRIVRTGTKFTMYLNGVQAWERDCTDHANGKDVTADMKADIYIRHWGDIGANVEIPFVIKKSVSLRGLNAGNGVVKTDKQRYFVGDNVTLTVHPNTGYKCTSLKVNGKELTANKDGTYSFIAEEETYNVVTTYG